MAIPRSSPKLSEKTESWIVQPGCDKVRLDVYLARLLADKSRSQIQSWIRKGQVQVNGKSVKTGYLVRSGDHILLHVAEPVPNTILPENIPLEVLYEDSDIAVINKPAGLACHPGAGIRSGTLVNALLYRMGPLEAEDPSRPGIVHRLDKLTSGVMLVAKNRFAHRQLAQQFKNRQVKKEYLAMVYGTPTPDSGTIDLPIGRDPKDRKKMSTRSRRSRAAITHYSVREAHGPLSLVEVRIETGRTHQIRVHLARKGYPVVGDSLYGGKRIRNLTPALQHAVRELQRPFLHSLRLEFSHPRSGETLSFVAPLAPELEKFLSMVKSRAQQ